MSNFSKCLEVILHHEGGYVNHPKDPGGETNLGVTKRVYEDFGGTKDMKELTSRLVTNINLPLMIDSTDSDKMEIGLKTVGGKCILNSTNYEDGEERFNQVLNLALNYGSGIVIGTIDEDGMARTSEKKYSIAKRALEKARKSGLADYEVFFDPLALPISTGIEEDRLNAKETIKAIFKIRENFPNIHIQILWYVHLLF